MEYILVTILLVILFLGIPYIQRKQTWKNLNQEIMNSDYEAFYYTLDTMRCKMSMSAFERENMRLSGYISQGRKEDVEKQIKMMANMRIKKAQKLALFERAFYYYLEQGRARKAKDMMELVESISPSRVEDLNIQYSILIKKESKYIKEVQEKLDRLWDGKSEMDMQKQMAVGVLEYLLGLQYAYKNDRTKMMEVFASAKKHLANTPYEESIDKVIKEKA